MGARHDCDKRNLSKCIPLNVSHITLWCICIRRDVDWNHSQSHSTPNNSTLMYAVIMTVSGGLSTQTLPYVHGVAQVVRIPDRRTVVIVRRASNDVGVGMQEVASVANQNKRSFQQHTCSKPKQTETKHMPHKTPSILMPYAHCPRARKLRQSTEDFPNGMLDGVAATHKNTSLHDCEWVEEFSVTNCTTGKTIYMLSCVVQYITVVFVINYIYTCSQDCSHLSHVVCVWLQMCLCVDECICVHLYMIICVYM